MQYGFSDSQSCVNISVMSNIANLNKNMVAKMRVESIHYLDYGSAKVY